MDIVLYIALGICAGIVLDELFANRVVEFAKTEFALLHSKLDAVINAVKK